MTVEQYKIFSPYKDICRIFATCGEYIGGADVMFDLIEVEYSTGKIDRSCNECRAGFLKFINTEIVNYEKTINN